MSTLYLGFGRTDMSPDGPITMNSQCTGTYVKDDEHVLATCLAWQEGEKTVLQFSLDLRGNYDPWRLPLLEKIEAGTGIPQDQIFISVTHNHSSPDVNFLHSRADVTDWAERIGWPQIVEAGRLALADLAPVTGAVGGKSEAHKCAFVRRYFREDGTFRSIAGAPSDSPIARHESEADPELRAVKIEREGKKSVVLVNFQTHAASALGQYKDRCCSDFVGRLRNVLEPEMDAFVVYFQGACGNTNIITVLPEEKEGWDKEYSLVGNRLADATHRALETGKKLSLSGLTVLRRDLICRVNHEKSHLADAARDIAHTRDPEEKAKKMAEAGITSRYELSAIMTRAQYPAERPMPLSSIKLGDLVMGFAPVELFDTCGKAYRDASPFPMTFFVGYSDGSHSYMPSANAFPNGGYEPLQCHYVPGTGERIALELAAQAVALKD